MAIENHTVRDIMSENVLVAHLTHSFMDVWRLFFSVKFHHLPVVDENNKLIGIVSTNDILKAMAYQLPIMSDISEDSLNNRFPISEIMTSDPISVMPEMKIKDAAGLFAERHFSALPVIENGDVVGIVTVTDVIKCLAKKDSGYKFMNSLAVII